MPRLARALVVVVAAASLAGCASSVSLQPAKDADDPLCAEVTVRLPATIDGQERRWTDAQATGAWGEPGKGTAVILTCGVEPPGPTTEACQAIEDVSGTSVDWLVVENEGSWVFTTYGRVPAVEVTVPDGVATAPVVDLNRAVSLAPQSRHCY